MMNLELKNRDRHALVVVADSNRARIFEAPIPLAPLSEIGGVERELAALKDSQLVTGDRGRHRDGVGQHRSAFEPSDSPGEVERRRFARDLSEALERLLQREGPLRVYVVAAPGFLGELRQQYGHELEHSTVMEIPKNLLEARAESIRDSLPEKL